MSRLASRDLIRKALGILVSFCAIAGITLVSAHLVSVNATTVALAYFLGVLVIATVWGLLEAVVASLVAVTCLNYFFLPPIATFTISDPQNWVALFAFLVTSIVASQLSAHAKRRAQEAMSRQQDLERLYALSRAILMIDPDQPAAKQIAHQIARAFDFRGVALFDRRSGKIYQAGPEDIENISDVLHEVAMQGTQFRDDERQIVATAVRLGGEPIGSLGIRGMLPPDTALQALCNLIAGGLEKIRAQQAASHAEAARQSQEFRSTLLDAIAHEFNTPLASIKTATSSIVTGVVENPKDIIEMLSVVDEEADRLKRFVNDALQLARVDASRVQLNLEEQPIPSIIQALWEEMRPVAEGRLIALDIAGDLPSVMIDGVLMKLAIRQLVDNALKYSSHSSPVEIGVRAEENGISVKVADRGHGIPDSERARIFEKFYRLPVDRARVPGTGMGLTIARQIVEAHGGRMSVEGREGGGSIFSLFIPLKRQEGVTQ